jgi:hypothetical protein
MTDPAEDAVKYQPMSMLAILAICVSGAFAIVMLSLTVAGLFTHKPVLEPLLILLSLIGVVLAVAARWQIRNAEGTLAGGRLANIALWLSVFVGCCYLAYFYGNALAIQQQAKDFAQKSFFEPLQQGDVEQVALISLPPHLRKGMSKQDIGVRFADTVTAMRHIELLSVVDRAGKQIEIVYNGVKDWKESQEGYDVALNYLVRTREGEFDVVISVVGVESKDSSGREWFVRSKAPFIRSKRLSTLGRMYIELQNDADRFLKDWTTTKMNPNFADLLYLDTLPKSRAERAQLHRTYLVQAVVGNSMAVGAAPGAELAVAPALVLNFGVIGMNRQLYLPGYDTYAKELIVFDERTQPQPTSVKEQLIPRLLTSSVLSPDVNPNSMEVPSWIDITKNEVRVSMPVAFALPSPLHYKAGGRVTAACRDPKLVAKINELASAPWTPGQPPARDDSDSVLRGFDHDWRIAQVTLDFTKRFEPPRNPGTPSPAMMK